MRNACIIIRKLLLLWRKRKKLYCEWLERAEKLFVRHLYINKKTTLFYYVLDT